MPRRLLLAAATIAALVSAPAARADWVWPVQGEVITPYRNGDDPYAAGQHRGIDIAAAAGTPVVAVVGLDSEHPNRRRPVRHLLPAPVVNRRPQGRPGGAGRPRRSGRDDGQA